MVHYFKFKRAKEIYSSLKSLKMYCFLKMFTALKCSLPSFSLPYYLKNPLPRSSTMIFDNEPVKPQKQYYLPSLP